MIDQILEYLRDHPEGISSADLAEKFLKFKNAGHAFAQKAVAGILGKDKRFACSADGRWSCARRIEATDSAALSALPWVAVHLVISGRRVLHASLWSVNQGQDPQPVLNGWLVDPAGFSSDERAALGVDGMVLDEPSRSAELPSRLAELLRPAQPFFVSSQHQGLLGSLLAAGGETLSDDATVASRLFRAAGESAPRPMDLAACYNALFSREPLVCDPGRGGLLLGECLVELLERLKAQGIETQSDLEAFEAATVETFDFSRKKFSASDIASLPKRPGVYGFKDQNGAFLYVGKANSLKRRIAGYFGETDESPAKLERLRNDSVELMTSLCGSELECLVLENRLIQKHHPVLNTQRGIDERKGSFAPIPDCIVLLPHAEEGKGLSIWYRGGQKVSLKPFSVDFTNTETFPAELQLFFFSAKLPEVATDFPEQEIVTRWLKRHRDTVLVVPVDRLASGEEVFAAMKSYWAEMDG